ncbi:hypothetical protein C9382_11865 [Pseudomonas aylmerensis]|uniref:Uncharacterized protein n=1 Tax=Pseudomonas aylmerensis TaxID=1869229 RepID=A0A2T4G1S7_9PSED|nr:hypothetical protein [Pseudomonas aylmerensis]OCW20913.1 hypothetical protein BBG20_25065 [Pseudomonas aylmerensis]PTC29605.1 hypothetical protein C9382_11865 [Pseudomonas aylmerensis]
MAKTSETPLAGAGSGSTFRDKLYTSRTLILPDSGRALVVLKQRVSVPATDAEALDYLKSNEEFELLQE